MHQFGYRNSLSTSITMGALTYIFIIGVVCINMSLQYTPFRKCATGLVPSEVRYSTCTKFPCVFQKSGIFSSYINKGEFDFVAVNDVKELNIILNGIYMGSWHNLLNIYDACSKLHGKQCPLSKGEKATYAIEYQIPWYYPSISSQVQILVKNEKNEFQACFEMDIQLQ